MRRMRLSLMVFVLSVWSVLAAAQDTWRAGEHYQVLPTPITTRDESKIEVVEMFWYGCPHCYEFNPLVKAWEKTLADDVDFYLVPGTLSKRWEDHARAFYVAEALGVGEKMHQPLFDAIVRDRKALAGENELAGFFAANGVDEADFRKAWKSFGVKARLDQADAKARNYRLTGVPAMIVNGKYRIDAGGAGGHENMLKIADFLIAQERNGAK